MTTEYDASELYHEHRKNVWTHAFASSVSQISKVAAWPDWEFLPEPLKEAWRATATASLVGQVHVVVKENEMEEETDAENGIVRRRTLWAGWIPVDGQTTVALPAHAPRRPNSNNSTVLDIHVDQLSKGIMT
jgi:hypothetical protein